MSGTIYRDEEIRGRSLRGQKLDDAEFRECDLSGTSFAAADLTAARFYKCKADAHSPVDFEGAMLDRARFEGCSFPHAILTKASLREAFVQETGLPGARLGVADFSAARFDEVDISLAHLHRARFVGAVFSRLKFEPVQALPRLRGLGFGHSTSAIRRYIETDDDAKVPFHRFAQSESAKTRGMAWLSRLPPWLRILQLPLILVGRTPENRLNVAATVVSGLSWLGLVGFVCFTYVHRGIATGLLGVPIEFLRGLRGSSPHGPVLDVLEYTILIVGSLALWFGGRTLRWRRVPQD
jgi:hypothetical protein